MLASPVDPDRGIDPSFIDDQAGISLDRHVRPPPVIDLAPQVGLERQSWTPACKAVIQFLYGPRALCPSFPRKREPRDFSRLLLGPRFLGGDGWRKLPI